MTEKREKNRVEDKKEEITNEIKKQRAFYTKAKGYKGALPNQAELNLKQ